MIDFILETNEPIDDPVVGVAIYNQVDVLVYGTNTAVRGLKLGQVEGRRRVCFDFGAIPMVEGRYFVTVGVHSRDETVHYLWLERQLSFRVLSLMDEVGVLHLDPHVEVVEA